MAQPAAATDSRRALADEPQAVRRLARNVSGRADKHPRRGPHPHRAPLPSWPVPAEIPPLGRRPFRLNGFRPAQAPPR
jgi:hypothetical protein